jgi:hypothetical protein
MADPKLDAAFGRIASIEISLMQLREIVQKEITALNHEKLRASNRLAVLEAQTKKENN